MNQRIGAGVVFRPERILGGHLEQGGIEHGLAFVNELGEQIIGFAVALLLVQQEHGAFDRGRVAFP